MKIMLIQNVAIIRNTLGLAKCIYPYFLVHICSSGLRLYFLVYAWLFKPFSKSLVKTNYSSLFQFLYSFPTLCLRATPHSIQFRRSGLALKGFPWYWAGLFNVALKTISTQWQQETPQEERIQSRGKKVIFTFIPSHP